MPKKALVTCMKRRLHQPKLVDRLRCSLSTVCESIRILRILGAFLLWIATHSDTYASIAQAVATARRLGSPRNYTMGFAHRVLHTTWESIATAIGNGERPQRPPEVQPGGSQKDAANHVFGAFSPNMKHSENPEELKEIALQVLEEWEGGPKEPLWTRPAYDGLTVCVEESTGRVWDDGYLLEAKA